MANVVKKEIAKPAIAPAVMAGETVAVGIIRGGDRQVAWPCPKCGSESKETHAGVTHRVCSARACRETFRMDRPVLVAETALSEACPKCMKALKAHHDGQKICSSPACRHVL